MRDVLSSLLDLAVPFFAMTSMASVGLAYGLRQILAPLRDLRLVALTLVASFVVVPLIAYALARAIALDEPYEVGLILVASSAGAPFLVKLVQVADADLAMASGVLVLLLVATVAYLPLALPSALPGVEVDVGAIAVTLAWTMLVPLALALLVAWGWPSLGARVRRPAGRAATASLVVVVTLTFVLNLRDIVQIAGEGAIAASFLLVGGALLAGYAAGLLVQRSGRRTARVLGLATAQRNIAAATVLAVQNFDDRDVLVMVVVTSLVSMAVLFPAAWAMRRYGARGLRPTGPRPVGHRP